MPQNAPRCIEAHPCLTLASKLAKMNAAEGGVQCTWWHHNIPPNNA